jgi:glucan phosphoethanolaminetransferase (alkaline phosphatase superfamily)
MVESAAPKTKNPNDVCIAASYNTFGKSGHIAPHWSFILCADFFGQSAVISSSQSTTCIAVLCFVFVSSFTLIQSLLHRAIGKITGVSCLTIRSVLKTRDRSDSK